MAADAADAADADTIGIDRKDGNVILMMMMLLTMMMAVMRMGEKV